MIFFLQFFCIAIFFVLIIELLLNVLIIYIFPNRKLSRVLRNAIR